MGVWTTCLNLKSSVDTQGDAVGIKTIKIRDATLSVIIYVVSLTHNLFITLSNEII